MTTFLKILLGLAGLGVVVFVHELGHFITARLAGIEVEAFALGWGKPILRKKIGSVEYRLCLFPLGGYCKMKGDNEFEKAWENNQNHVEPDRSSFLSAAPWRRIIVALGGPLFNFFFAVLVLTMIWGIGFKVETPENRIVLLSDIDGGSYPSDQGGLKSGDRILEINGKAVRTYHDIQENIALNPEKRLPVTVERDGAEHKLTLIPNLDKSGSGKIGVYYWADPVIRSVAGDSPADKAGLRSGDRIISINGESLPYTMAVLRILRSPEGTERPESFPLEYERAGSVFETRVSGVEYTNGFPLLGIDYVILSYRTPSLSVPAALVQGSREAVKTLTVSVKSLALLFKDIDLTQAVSGPARITYMVGDIAAAGFGDSVGTGLSSVGSFLALISIALCIMNLLPLPILDGGLIVLFVIEMIRRKPIHPRVVSAFQTLGVIIIFGLMIFALFSDILFFTKR